MDSAELKALKRQWYVAAVEDGSVALCFRVARVLGRPQAVGSGPKYSWEADGVSIYLDDYGKYLTVEVGGKRVCSTHDCEQLFVPGEWMNAVRRAAVTAAARQEREEHYREEAERRRLMAQLGIED